MKTVTMGGHALHYIPIDVAVNVLPTGPRPTSWAYWLGSMDHCQPTKPNQVSSRAKQLWAVIILSGRRLTSLILDKLAVSTDIKYRSGSAHTIAPEVNYII